MKNINPKLREYDVRIKPTAHVSPPAIAVKRHVIALQRTDANGPRRKVNAIARDPIQTERRKKNNNKKKKTRKEILFDYYSNIIFDISGKNEVNLDLLGNGARYEVFLFFFRWLSCDRH